MMMNFNPLLSDPLAGAFADGPVESPPVPTGHRPSPSQEPLMHLMDGVLPPGRLPILSIERGDPHGVNTDLRTVSRHFALTKQGERGMGKALAALVHAQTSALRAGDPVEGDSSTLLLRTARQVSVALDAREGLATIGWQAHECPRAREPQVVPRRERFEAAMKTLDPVLNDARVRHGDEAPTLAGAVRTFSISVQGLTDRVRDLASTAHALHAIVRDASRPDALSETQWEALARYEDIVRCNLELAELPERKAALETAIRRCDGMRLGSFASPEVMESVHAMLTLTRWSGHPRASRAGSE